MFATFNGFTIRWRKEGYLGYNMPIVSYTVLTPEPVTLFNGTRFKPSITAVHNELLIPIEILQWVTLEHGEVDETLFNDYTKEQLEFASCERISEFSYIMDIAWEEIYTKQYLTVVNENGMLLVDLFQLPYPLTVCDC